MKRFWFFLFLVFVLMLAACERTAPIDPTAQPTQTGTEALSLSDLTNQTLTAKAVTVTVAAATSSPTLVDTPTATAEATEPPPTSTSETDTATATVQEDDDVTPTETSSPRPTATATNTLTAQQAAIQLMAEINFERFFDVQEGSPATMSNWAHPEAGCNWLSVAGQVFNLENDPEIGFIVEAGGSLEGEPILGLSLTGLGSVYGPGGFEIQLADQPIASQDQVWVQLKDEAGNPLSYPIYFQTYDNCDKNVILLNFVEVADVPPPPETFTFFLPMVQGP
jgi:hypothetical protein